MLNEEQFNQLSPTEKYQLQQKLEALLQDTRLKILQKVIQHRTDYITVVMENIYQGHNASAILRSCDCFGIMDVHAIEDKNTLKLNSNITMGADKWINIHRYNSTKNAIKTLKKQKYKIYATTLNQNSISLQDISLDNKVAFIMGTEKNGLSKEALELADDSIKINMYGFCQSFNVSISTALILMDITNRLRQQNNINYSLTEQRKNFIYIKYLLEAIKFPDIR